MKKKAFFACMLAVCFAIASFAFAQPDDTAQHKSCKYCGMDREKFAHSRMLIEYDDGTKVGTCSIHCSAVDLTLNIDKTPVTIWVGDFMTKKLVDAEKAYWGIGGSKPGVMTKKAKWAFASKEDADTFMKEKGLDKLQDAGARIERCGADITVRRNGRLKPVDITTLPYSGFPTDVQTQMMALMTLTPGISIITERIFESRSMHVSELARLGADIEIEGPSAIVKGGKQLSGAQVMASDLRASAALVIAGLAARGTAQVNRVYHIDRGYENIDGKLGQLGARIERIEES